MDGHGNGIPTGNPGDAESQPPNLLGYLGEPPFEPRRQLLGSARGGPDLKDFLQGSRSGIHFRALVPRDAKRDMIANLKAVKGELRSLALAPLALARGARVFF